MFSMSQAIKLANKRSFSFKGRSSRSEYWWTFLAFYIAMFILMIPIILIAMIRSEELLIGVVIIIGVLFLYLMIMFITLTVRRLHDLNHSGWCCLGYMVAIFIANILSAITDSLEFSSIIALGSLVLNIIWIVFMATPGTQGVNAYGINPTEDTEGHYHYYMNGMHKKMGPYGSFKLNIGNNPFQQF